MVMLCCSAFTLQLTLLLFELCSHFLVGFTDQFFCNNGFALFAGELNDIVHLTRIGKHADIFRLYQIDTTGSFLSVLCAVDDFRTSLSC